MSSAVSAFSWAPWRRTLNHQQWEGIQEHSNPQGRDDPHYIINQKTEQDPSHNIIAVSVVTTTVRTTTHGNDVTRLRHLIVQLCITGCKIAYSANCRSHLVCNSTRHNHHIRLTRSISVNQITYQFLRSTRNHTKTLKVETGTWSLYDGWDPITIKQMTYINHLHSAASETEGEREDRARTAVGNDAVDGGDGSIDGVVDFLRLTDGNLIRVRKVARHLLRCRVRRIPHRYTLTREKKTRFGVSTNVTGMEVRNTFGSHSSRLPWRPN